MIRTVLQWSDLLITFAVALSWVILPALVALFCMSRPSEHGLDWGSRPRLLAVALALILVFGLMFVFGYVYTSSDTCAAWCD